MYKTRKLSALRLEKYKNQNKKQFKEISHANVEKYFYFYKNSKRKYMWKLPPRKIKKCENIR